MKCVRLIVIHPRDVAVDPQVGHNIQYIGQQVRHHPSGKEEKEEVVFVVERWQDAGCKHRHTPVS